MIQKLTTLLFILCLTLSVQAQKKPGFSKEEFRAKQEAYLTQKAELTAEEAGLYCAINPLFASCLGHWFLAETLGAAGILGAAYILTGLGFVNWKGLSQERQTCQRSAVNDQRPLTIDH